MKREILRSAAVFFAKEPAGPIEVFRFVEHEQADHAVAAVAMLCWVLGVSTSGYHAQCTRGPVGPRTAGR